jgi:methylmalonyl-CoA carboxyltransferase small subunit
MKLKVTVEGKQFEVEVEVLEKETPVAGGTSYVPRQAAIPAPAAAPAAGAPPAGDYPVEDESKVCRSPLAGNVVRIKAEPGTEVKADEALMILEAMKMETSITAHMPGKIKAVPVAAGQAVQQGQVLVEFE